MHNEFDSVFYPYYAHLTAAQQGAYRQVLTAVRAGAPECVLRGAPLAPGEVSVVMTALHADRPELFWLDGSSRYRHGGGVVHSVSPGYNALAANRSANQAALQRAVRAFLSGTAGKQPWQQERVVHDSMARDISYVHTPDDQNVFGALVRKQAVCAGYARGFQLLMHTLDIPCCYCSGLGRGQGAQGWGRHSWNLVRLNGEWYNLDLTWNDQFNPGRAHAAIEYRYYNGTDSAFAADHRRDTSCAFLPRCTGTEYAFEKINGGIDAGLQRVLSDGVTHSSPVCSRSDYQALILPLMRKGKGTHIVSFPARGRDVQDNLSAWFHAAAKSPGLPRCRMNMNSRITDYQNGWYRVELTLTMS